VKILFTSTLRTPFIERDLKFLRSQFDVDAFIARGIAALIQLPVRIAGVDATFTWFASVYSAFVVFFARVLGKRSFVVIGGVDVARNADIGYGIWLSPWKSVLIRYTMIHATRILAVDPSLKEKAKILAGYPGKNIDCIPTGYDPDEWSPSGEKEPVVLTVAGCNDESRLRAKGLDLFFQCARLIPHIRFVAAGVGPAAAELLKASKPDNVEIVPYIGQDDLVTYYRRAKVYCQPSRVEGLPNSLCEAMLCGCIPVGTRVGGIPTAIGDVGFLVEDGDISGLVDAIQRALEGPVTLGQKARARIATHFSRETREAALVEVLTRGSL
jgi:glycosyltransferase involved in cell wall biosynthesis